MAHKPGSKPKPSDYTLFALKVYEASETYMPLEDYLEVYHDLLHVLFYNPDFDNDYAVEYHKQQNEGFKA